jgi:hypothetical protein
MKTLVMTVLGMSLVVGCSMNPTGHPDSGARASSVLTTDSPAPPQQMETPAPGPSQIGTLATPAPTRVERLNPNLTKEQILGRFIERLMATDPTIHPSPAPGVTNLEPIGQPRPVITAQRIDLRTAQWVKDNRPQEWTGDLTLDSPVWVAEIEGEIPQAALTQGSGQPGMARRIVVLFSAETGTMISMSTYQ